MKNFNFRDAIQIIVDEIIDADKRSNLLHKASNINESGAEVETLIRSKLSLFLPERYMVKQGQIIDEMGNVSNQYDIIIFDRLNTPKFFESRNGTVYYPIESVLAIGEIKKTLKQEHTSKFAENIFHYRNVMKRKLVENTFYGISAVDADMRDVLMFDIRQKYKNPLFTFIFAINGDLMKTNVGEPIDLFCNDLLILNDGYRMHGSIIDGKFKHLVADDHIKINEIVDYRSSPVDVLALFLNRLMMHLNRCHVDPFTISNYISKGEEFKIENEKVKVYDVSNYRTMEEKMKNTL
ncbi:DUF6602 domain-containing protein [Chryseobacterium viscerum]|uniref:DUF6602 domain-containing protein n=1 Tax=Chryseobacterium viscerum TaxID=1037377 RepID=A0A316WQT5_9FLAO|nr:DUF6602 domain-containing protein [Chryseobacterium viscerum]PWN60900.1 hypothetical protein C1634_012580 [Chryseobacterium viscerum]